MIVSNTVVTKLDPFSLGVAEPTPGISPDIGAGGVVVCPVVDVEPTVGTSPVTDAPTPGMSPANAVPQKTHASVNAINSRFMDCLL
jgi:hypothetical protein